MNPAKWWALQNGGNINDYRECIYGFPCRLILVNDGTTPLNEGQEEPSPGNTKDMGIFNFNLDKDCPNSLGFAIEDFPNVMSFEVTANSDTSAGAFISYANWNGDKSTVSELDYLLQSFEVRYNKYDDDTFGILDVNGDTNLGLKRIVDFVDNSTDEEFVNNFEEYFLKDYTLRYYILVIVLGMVDNLGKNCMWDSYDGKIFMPRFYDCDTICSYDNSGAIKFDVDIEMAQGYWNTSSSRLWTRVRDLFHDELVETYKNMRQNGMSYESFMSYFYDEQISMIPQRYYNMDYDVKYAPYSTEYMGKAHGNGYEHLKRWLKNRLIFTDTLFDYAPAYTNDMLTIRANTDQPMSLTIETYTPVYQHLSWYNGNMEKEKIAKGTSFTFTGTAQTSTDQEVLIYGGSNIKRITGISSMNPDSMLIGSATRLVELEVTDCPILTDINSSKANLEAHTYLSKLDLSNCPQLGGTLRVNQSPLLREINIQGTAITNLQLPSSIRNLEKLQLPSAITDLTLNDAPLLKSLYFEGENSLTSVSMTNCNNLTDVINFDLTQVPKVILNNSYDTEELYMSKTTNLTLNNMKNLKRLIYIPNAEIEEFDLSNLMSASEYAITTFNCPNLTDFITTSQQRTSYRLTSDGNIYPNKVFMASLLDLSNTQFSNIKFLCTTDLYKLMLPTTVKNFYCDSAFDLDTTVVTDGDYDIVHGDLIEPYTKEYNENVLIGKEVEVNLPQNTSEVTRIVTEEFQVFPNSEVTLTCNDSNEKYSVQLYGTTLDGSKKLLTYLIGTGTVNIKLNNEIKYIFIGYYQHLNCTVKYSIPQIPNIVPTSANGSLIYNVWSQLGTQPSSTSPYIWDLTGLKFNDFHTYGMNNWIKTDENGNITMPQRTTGYSVRLQNADITPNNYNTMLYPLFIDTTLPIVGKIDYSQYKGNNLSWAFAYTTNQVNRTPMDSRDMGNIKYDYNKLYNTDYVDIKDVWVYKDTDCSSFSTNGNITKAYIELTQDNYTTRIDEVLTHYPNCNDVYFYGDGSVTSLESIMDMSNNSSNNSETRGRISYITFLRDGFVNSINLNASFANTNLISINFNNLKVKNMGYCFQSCKKLTTVKSSELDTSNCSYFYFMFKNNNVLKEIDVSDWNMSNAISIKETFYGCSGLTVLDISKWSLAKLTDMQSAFYNCSGLKVLDFSNANLSKVNVFTNAFRDCSNIKELILGGSSTTVHSPQYFSTVFSGCTSLTKVDLSKFSAGSISLIASPFNKCSALTDIIPFSGGLKLPHDLSSCTSLSASEIVEWINSLATVTDSPTLTLGATNLAKLTDEQKTLATNKGWTLA